MTEQLDIVKVYDLLILITLSKKRMKKLYGDKK